MTASLYFGGADAKLKQGSTEITACDSWSFEVSWQVNKKFSADSIFMRAAAKYQMEVAVKLKFYKVDPTAGETGTFWLYKMMAGGGATNVDKNGTAIPLGKIGDTSKCTFLDISGTVSPFSDTTGTVKFDVTAENTTLSSFPFALKANEWMGFEVSGDAEDVVYTNPT